MLLLELGERNTGLSSAAVCEKSSFQQSAVSCQLKKLK
jgi:hypothetical protein